MVVYSHFGGMPELLAAVAERGFQSLREAFSAVEPSADPVADLFSMLPYEFPQQLFHDPAVGATMMTGGFDFDDREAIKRFLIGNSRRLGTAGKIMFPIPNRRLAKRLYRLTNPTLVLWGESDRLIPPVYAREWVRLLPHARPAFVEAAGHMLPYEQPVEVAGLVADFLA